MKKGAFFILALLVFSFAEAQVPEGIKYQAVARDIQGGLLANQNVNLKITLVDSAQGGALVFQETHKIATNQFGLFSVTTGTVGVALARSYTNALPPVNGRPPGSFRYAPTTTRVPEIATE